jgi:DNA-binding NtrC family response regulator
MVKSDEFREDLYFRVNTFEIRLPSLRERRQDIPELARYLLARAARRPVDQVAGLLTPEAIDALLEYAWPGNVREMANVMEHAYIIAAGEPITSEHLPFHLRPQSPRTTVPGLSSRETIPMPPRIVPLPVNASARTLKEVEMEHIFRVLDKHQGSKPAAAAELGIVLKTLYNKLNQWQEEQSQKAAG